MLGSSRNFRTPPSQGETLAIRTYGELYSSLKILFDNEILPLLSSMYSRIAASEVLCYYLRLFWDIKTLRKLRYGCCRYAANLKLDDTKRNIGTFARKFHYASELLSDPLSLFTKLQTQPEKQIAILSPPTSYRFNFEPQPVWSENYEYTSNYHELQRENIPQHFSKTGISFFIRLYCRYFLFEALTYNEKFRIGGKQGIVVQGCVTKLPIFLQAIYKPYCFALCQKMVNVTNVCENSFKTSLRETRVNEWWNAISQQQFCVLDENVRQVQVNNNTAPICPSYLPRGCEKVPFGPLIIANLLT